MRHDAGLYAALILAMLLLGLQYQLWFGAPNVSALSQLQVRITDLSNLNRVYAERNRALAAEVSDLKNGLAEIETRARYELGYVGADETFYRVIESPTSLSPFTLDSQAITSQDSHRIDSSDSNLGRCSCGRTRDSLRRCPP